MSYVGHDVVMVSNNEVRCRNRGVSFRHDSFRVSDELMRRGVLWFHISTGAFERTYFIGSPPNHSHHHYHHVFFRRRHFLRV